MQKFSLIIPIYNEEENISKLLNEIVNVNLYDKINEIIFIDDCSIDNSKKVISSLIDKYKKISLYSHNKNMGQSFSILTGIKKSLSNNIITMDGDGQNPPNDINKLINEYNLYNYPILLAGIRVNRKDTLEKKITSYFANKIRSTILQDSCMDTGCALKIFRRNDFLKLPFFDGIHRFLPALFKGFGKNTLFIDVDHRPRISGISKYGTLDRLYKGIIDIVRVIKVIKDKGLKK